MQGLSWTEIYFGHFVQATPILFHIWKFLGHFFRHSFLPQQTEIAICPSHMETRGSFATILDGMCGLIDWMAFYLMMMMEVGGVLFFAAIDSRFTTC